jgi:hypothetical protein
MKIQANTYENTSKYLSKCKQLQANTYQNASKCKQIPIKMKADTE